MLPADGHWHLAQFNLRLRHLTPVGTGLPPLSTELTGVKDFRLLSAALPPLLATRSRRGLAWTTSPRCRRPRSSWTGASQHELECHGQLDVRARRHYGHDEHQYRDLQSQCGQLADDDRRRPQCSKTSRSTRRNVECPDHRHDRPAILALDLRRHVQTTTTVANPETINAPLVLEGSYTFTSAASGGARHADLRRRNRPWSDERRHHVDVERRQHRREYDQGCFGRSWTWTSRGRQERRWRLDTFGRQHLFRRHNRLGRHLGVRHGSDIGQQHLRFMPMAAPAIQSHHFWNGHCRYWSDCGGGQRRDSGTGGHRLSPGHGANRVNITNSSTTPAGILVSGTNQIVGKIDGTGTTQVNAGSSLTASHIVQSSLAIGGSATSAATVTIAASNAAGTPLIGFDPSAAGDLSSPLSNFSVSPVPNGPFAGDGVGSANFESISSNDVDLVSASIGDSIASGNSGAVPEPSSFLLLAIGGATALFMINRRWPPPAPLANNPAGFRSAPRSCRMLSQSSCRSRRGLELRAWCGAARALPAIAQWQEWAKYIRL